LVYFLVTYTFCGKDILGKGNLTPQMSTCVFFFLQLTILTNTKLYSLKKLSEMLNS